MVTPGGCPFCGAAIDSTLHYLRYECGTWLHKGSELIRNDPCYKRQLTHQADIIRRAVEVLQELVDSAERQDFYSFVKTVKLTGTRAQALLPALEKALEVK